MHRGEGTECGCLLAGVEEVTAIRGIDEMVLVSKHLAAKDPMEMEGCEAFSNVAGAWDITCSYRWEIVDIFVETI